MGSQPARVWAPTRPAADTGPLQMALRWAPRSAVSAPHSSPAYTHLPGGAAEAVFPDCPGPNFLAKRNKTTGKPVLALLSAYCFSPGPVTTRCAGSCTGWPSDPGDAAGPKGAPEVPAGHLLLACGCGPKWGSPEGPSRDHPEAFQVLWQELT